MVKVKLDAPNKGPTSVENRRKWFTAALEITVDTLHRKRVNFVHFPRRQVNNKPKEVDPKLATSQLTLAKLSQYAGPVLTDKAKTSLMHRLNRRRTGPEIPQRVADSEVQSTASAVDYMNEFLSTVYSPRRQARGSPSPLPAHVQHSWFRNTSVPLVGTVTDALQLPGVVQPRHDATKPTEAYLRHQGLTPQPHLHEGDGYISPEVLTRRRREYHSTGTSKKRETAAIRLRKDVKRQQARSSPDVHTQSLLVGVFVRGGDVGSYIRKHEREAASGLLRPDERRSMKLRLGGSSGPRLM
jgi:hypothetical protein